LGYHFKASLIVLFGDILESMKICVLNREFKPSSEMKRPLKTERGIIWDYLAKIAKKQEQSGNFK